MNHDIENIESEESMPITATFLAFSTPLAGKLQQRQKLAAVGQLERVVDNGYLSSTTTTALIEDTEAV